MPVLSAIKKRENFRRKTMSMTAANLLTGIMKKGSLKSILPPRVRRNSAEIDEKVNTEGPTKFETHQVRKSVVTSTPKFKKKNNRRDSEGNNRKQFN